MKRNTFRSLPSISTNEKTFTAGRPVRKGKKEEVEERENSCCRTKRGRKRSRYETKGKTKNRERRKPGERVPN